MTVLPIYKEPAGRISWKASWIYGKWLIYFSLQKVPESRNSVEQLLNNPWILNNAGQVDMQLFMQKIKQLMEKWS